MLPRNRTSARLRRLGQLRLEVGEHAQLRVVGVGDVQVGLVMAAPGERLASGDPLDVGDVHSPRAEQLDVLLAEVIARPARPRGRR